MSSSRTPSVSQAKPKGKFTPLTDEDEAKPCAFQPYAERDAPLCVPNVNYTIIAVTLPVSTSTPRRTLATIRQTPNLYAKCVCTVLDVLFRVMHRRNKTVIATELGQQMPVHAFIEQVMDDEGMATVAYVFRFIVGYRAETPPEAGTPSEDAVFQRELVSVLADVETGCTPEEFARAANEIANHVVVGTAAYAGDGACVDTLSTGHILSRFADEARFQPVRLRGQSRIAADQRALDCLDAHTPLGRPILRIADATHWFRVPMASAKSLAISSLPERGILDLSASTIERLADVLQNDPAFVTDETVREVGLERMVSSALVKSLPEFIVLAVAGQPDHAMETARWCGNVHERLMLLLSYMYADSAPTSQRAAANVFGVRQSALNMPLSAQLNELVRKYPAMAKLNAVWTLAAQVERTADENIAQSRDAVLVVAATWAGVCSPMLYHNVPVIAIVTIGEGSIGKTHMVTRAITQLPEANMLKAIRETPMAAFAVTEAGRFVNTGVIKFLEELTMAEPNDNKQNRNVQKATLSSGSNTGTYRIAFGKDGQLVMTEGAEPCKVMLCGANAPPPDPKHGADINAFISRFIVVCVARYVSLIGAAQHEQKAQPDIVSQNVNRCVQLYSDLMAAGIVNSEPTIVTARFCYNALYGILMATMAGIIKPDLRTQSRQAVMLCIAVAMRAAVESRFRKPVDDDEEGLVRADGAQSDADLYHRLQRCAAQRVREPPVDEGHVSDDNDSVLDDDDDDNSIVSGFPAAVTRGVLHGRLPDIEPAPKEKLHPLGEHFDAFRATDGRGRGAWETTVYTLLSIPPPVLRPAEMAMFFQSLSAIFMPHNFQSAARLLFMIVANARLQYARQPILIFDSMNPYCTDSSLDAYLPHDPANVDLTLVQPTNGDFKNIGYSCVSVSPTPEAANDAGQNDTVRLSVQCGQGANRAKDPVDWAKAKLAEVLSTLDEHLLRRTNRLHIRGGKTQRRLWTYVRDSYLHAVQNFAHMGVLDFGYNNAGMTLEVNVTALRKIAQFAAIVRRVGASVLADDEVLVAMDTVYGEKTMRTMAPPELPNRIYYQNCLLELGDRMRTGALAAAAAMPDLAGLALATEKTLLLTPVQARAIVTCVEMAARFE